MTDNDFVSELVERLNLFLKGSPERANRVLRTPLLHAQYATVGHFLGQLGLPRHITKDTEIKDMEKTLFIVPCFNEQRITHFRTATGKEIQELQTSKTD